MDPEPETASSSQMMTNDFHEPLLNMHEPAQPIIYDEEFPSLGNPSGPNSDPTSGLSSPGASSKWSQKMRIESNIVTSVFHIPFEERSDKNHSHGGDDNLRDCAEIIKRTGAHVEMSNSSRDQSLTFLITGRQKSVLEAKAEILKHFQTQAMVQVAIPKEHHRFILGKLGNTLSKLEKATSTRIHVPRTNDDSTMIQVTGTRDGIEKAVHEIQLISDEQSKQASERLTIPKKYHPFIYGPHNEKVNRLMDETNVRINIPPNSVMNDDIFIVGEKEGVAKAVHVIKKEFEEWKRYATVSVEVGKSQHKYIIGPKRNTIHEILAKTNVSVEMPPPESSSETITLRGPTEALGNALTLVYEKANSVVTRNVEAPAWIHKYVIGKKGSNIRNLTMNYPRVHVEIKENENSIVVEGPPEEVDPVCQDLQKCIEELVDKMYSKDITVDPKYHKHIIGKNGTNVNRLKDETGVLISVKDGNSAVIHLEGSRQGVELAYSKLMEQVEKLDSEKEKELSIDHRFHGNIIGARGEKIREIRDQFNNVQINFPAQGEKKNVVQVRGVKEDVDRCCRHLMQIYKELQDNSYQIKVPIFPQTYRHVVGKGGANIKKIREETKTRFELPSLEDKVKSEAEIIVITGKKENCEKARDRLLAIQSSVANVIESTVMIPNKFHNSLIGARGKFIQSISEECGGINIKFPDSKLKSDSVTLIGPKEDVEKARALLLEHSREKEDNSYTETFEANFQEHKFLIGKNGLNIKRIRENAGGVVRIVFPNDGDIITIIGKKECVQKVKAELNDMLVNKATAQELFIKRKEEQIEKARIRELKSYEIKITVDPEFHPKIIGRKGLNISKIRDKYDVNIQLPKRGDPEENIITIIGFEDKAKAAGDEIMGIVEGVLEMSKFKEEVEIDHRVHSRIIGARGKTVRKIMDDYNVDIRFPRNGEENMNLVVISGANKDKLLDAKDHLQNMEEEYLQDVTENEYLQQYVRDGKGQANDSNKKAQQTNGFIVKGAPWEAPDTQSTEEFPSFVAAAEAPPVVNNRLNAAWGARKHF